MNKEDFMKAINSSVGLADNQTDKPDNTKASLMPAKNDSGSDNEPYTEIATNSPKKAAITSDKLEAMVDNIQDEVDNLKFSFNEDVTCPNCGVTFDFTVSYKEKGFFGSLTSDFNNQHCFKCPCCEKELEEVTLKTSGTVITASQYSAYLKQHGISQDSDS
jgi:hypothetical protein